VSTVREGDSGAAASVAPAPRPRRTRTAVAALVAAVAGCASPAVEPELVEAERLRAWLERVLADRPRPAPDALRVYLAFAGDVDLDLYVTDPTQETVYFANTPSRAGGRLDADLQCSASAEGDRVERVRFAEPPPGRYRVSVDHPRSCGARRSAGYALAVEHGGRLTFHTGSVGLREFQLVSLEFELPSAAPTAPSALESRGESGPATGR
jgi:hypothetical protein